MLICGFDEAGRGPVCGPLTIGCVVIDDGQKKQLKKLGVKDSKLLKPARREELAKEIKELVHSHKVVKLDACYIDRCRDFSSLNEIEAEEIGKLLNIVKPKKADIDSPDRPGSVFADRIRRYLKQPVQLYSRNFAESRYPVVAAASILAKVERDREIMNLHEAYGFFGSGYPSDEVTIKFLQEWIRKNKDYPEFVRKSWYTSERLMEEKVQRRIGDWF